MRKLARECLCMCMCVCVCVSQRVCWCLLGQQDFGKKLQTRNARCEPHTIAQLCGDGDACAAAQRRCSYASWIAEQTTFTVARATCQRQWCCCCCCCKLGACNLVATCCKLLNPVVCVCICNRRACAHTKVSAHAHGRFAQMNFASKRTTSSELVRFHVCLPPCSLAQSNPHTHTHTCYAVLPLTAGRRDGDDDDDDSGIREPATHLLHALMTCTCHRHRHLRID